MSRIKQGTNQNQGKNTAATKRGKNSAGKVPTPQVVDGLRFARDWLIVSDSLLSSVEAELSKTHYNL